MAAEAYWYYTDYQPNIREALHTLRQKEFEAGRYNPVVEFPKFPITGNSPSPGTKHASIEAVMEELMTMGAAEGTRSILDILRISDEPYTRAPDLGMFTAFPLNKEDLLELFGTDKPTHVLIEKTLFGDDLPHLSTRKKQVVIDKFWGEKVDRGRSVYITLYRKNVPVEIFFAGLSID